MPTQDYDILDSLNVSTLDDTHDYAETMQDRAEELDYPGYLVYLLNGCDAADYAENYPEACNALSKKIKTRDPVLFMQYARNMVERWIYQDLAIRELNKFGIEFELHGFGKNRCLPIPLDYDEYCEYMEREPQDKPEEEQDPPYMADAVYNGKTLPIEFVLDKKGNWNKYFEFSSNFDVLTSLDEGHGLIVGLTIPNPRKYFILDFSSDVTYDENTTPYGKKYPVLSFIENKLDLQPLNWEAIANKIKEKMPK